LSRSDGGVPGEDALRFESLLSGRTGEGEPVFPEPWQAQAFALVVHLHARGAFSWPRWATALSEALRSANARGDPDDGTGYFEHWLSALEGLVRECGFADEAALQARRQTWAEAYRQTRTENP